MHSEPSSALETPPLGRAPPLQEPPERQGGREGARGRAPGTPREGKFLAPLVEIRPEAQWPVQSVWWPGGPGQDPSQHHIKVRLFIKDAATRTSSPREMLAYQTACGLK